MTDDRSARAHPKQQIAQIAASFQAFGVVSPLVVDAQGQLIAGHGRLAAARLLKHASVPVVRLDHLDEAQKRALRIADNQLAALAGWDQRLLALEFKDLLALDLTLDLSFDLAITGFTAAEIDKLVDGTVSKSGKHAEFCMGVGELSEGEFTAFLTRFLTHSRAFSRKGAIHFAFMDWRHMGEMLAAGQGAGLELKNLCVWNKRSAGMGGGGYRSRHELAFMWKDPGAPHINNVALGKFGRNRTNVWDFPGAAGLRKELELHPTPKPVALVAEAIRDVSDRNNIVLDCFSGSGTTVIAAAKTGRRARVIELDPHYVDVAVRRWQDWSGETATHAAGGLSFAQLAEQRAAPPDPTDVAPCPAVLRRSCAEPALPAPSPVRVRRRVPVVAQA